MIEKEYRDNKKYLIFSFIHRRKDEPKTEGKDNFSNTQVLLILNKTEKNNKDIEINKNRFYY